MLYSPFYLHDGTQIRDPLELACLIQDYPDEISAHVYHGNVTNWLTSLKLDELAGQVAELTRQTDKRVLQVRLIQQLLQHYLIDDVTFIDRWRELRSRFILIQKKLVPDSIVPLLTQLFEQEQNFHRIQNQVVFFGVFKSGKSSLINALIDMPILPARSNRATGAITHIRFGKTKEAEVFFSEAGNNPSRKVPFNEVSKYIQLDTSKGSARLPRNVQLVTINLPHALLSQKIILVDTLGLKDKEQFSKITYQELLKADLAVAVLSPDQLLSEEEQRAVEIVHEQLSGNIIFVLNRWDQVEKKEQKIIIEWTNSFVSQFGNPWIGQPNIFTTTSITGANGAKDATITALSDWLTTLFSSPRGNRVRLISLLGRLRLVASNTHHQLIIEQNKKQKEFKQRHKQMQDAHDRVYKQYRQHTRQISRSIAQVEQGLFDWAEEFGKDCIIAFQTLAVNDSNWQREEKIRKVFHDAINKFSNKVNLETSTAIRKSNYTLQKFDLNVKEASIELPEDYAGIVGGIIGGAIGFFAGGWGAVFGASVGASIGNLVFGVDKVGETRKSIAKGAKALKQPLISAAHDYVTKVNEDFNKYRTKHTPQFSKPHDVLNLEDEVKTLTKLALESKALANIAETLLGELK